MELWLFRFLLLFTPVYVFLDLVSGEEEGLTDSLKKYVSIWKGEQG